MNDTIDNFQGAMELMPQEVEVLADKVTKLQHLPFTNASDQEILQFEEILARNAKRCATNYGFKAKFMKATKITNVNLVVNPFLMMQEIKNKYGKIFDEDVMEDQIYEK